MALEGSSFVLEGLILRKPEKSSDLFLLWMFQLIVCLALLLILFLGATSTQSTHAVIRVAFIIFNGP